MANVVVVGDIIWDSEIQRGGQTMIILQWLHGLERLGHRVLFLDFADAKQMARTESNLAAYRQLMAEWWHPEYTCLVCENKSRYGVEFAEAERFVTEAAAVIQIAIPGQRQAQPLIEKIRPRILIDHDPAYSHLWAAGGEPAEIFGEHEFYFTVASNIGSPRCRVPQCGLNWRPIWNPVVMEWWPTDAPVTRDRFTTVADWYFFGYLEFEGQTLGPKAEEFSRFINLPRLAGEDLGIALQISPDDPDVARLQQHGWQIETPAAVGSPNLYRDFVAGSIGEFSCAKGGYVGTRCGWFSDRSACYLAAGRPVVLQGTGFSDVLPTGKGLFSVGTAEEAGEAIRAIRKDYRQHSAAARAIALEHFDSNKILSRLLAEAGVSSQTK